MKNIRIATLVLLIAGVVGCVGIKKTKMETISLNGTWIPVKQEMGGKTFPEAALQNQKLIIADTTYTLVAESVDKGTVKYNGNKMDIYGKDGPNAGKHFTAIYKLENGALTICYNLKGDSYPATFETAGKPLFFLSVFKKE